MDAYVVISVYQRLSTMPIFNCRNHDSESFTVWSSTDMLTENNLRLIIAR